MAQQLSLARHAQSRSQSDGLLLGKSDVPLGDLGERQADALGVALRRLSPERCFCSPLARARQTMERSNLAAVIEDDLREVDFGRWEGRTFEEIAASEGDAVERWAAFDPQFAFPEGEGLADFFSRAGRVADRLAADPAQRVLAVTHGGVIRAMICHLLGLDQRHSVLFDVKPASLTTMALHDGKGVLTGLNDTCHLEGL